MSSSVQSSPMPKISPSAYSVRSSFAKTPLLSQIGLTSWSYLDNLLAAMNMEFGFSDHTFEHRDQLCSSCLTRERFTTTRVVKTLEACVSTTQALEVRTPLVQNGFDQHRPDRRDITAEWAWIGRSCIRASRNGRCGISSHHDESRGLGASWRQRE